MFTQSGRYRHYFPDQSRRENLRRNVYRPHQWHCRQRVGAGKRILDPCFQRIVPNLSKRRTAYRRTARGTPIRTAKPHGKSCLGSCRHAVGLGRCAGCRGAAKNPATAEASAMTGYYFLYGGCSVSTVCPPCFSCFRKSGGIYISEPEMTCLRRGVRFRASGVSDYSLLVFGLVFV